MRECAKEETGSASAWFRFTGTDQSASRGIRAALSAADVVLYPFENSAPEENGILCFSEVNNILLSIVRDIRQNRTGRILALANSISVLQSPLTWRLLNAGVSEVLSWDGGGSVAKQIRAKLARWSAIDELTQSVASRGLLIGDSQAWLTLVRAVIEAAHFTTAPVLLMGESGTGKELLAQLIHLVDGRASEHRVSHHELVTVDCSTIVPDLSGSELFGHEKGAFTHALNARDGAFALADGGTLFLDEVGELPLALQAQLLRAVQEKKYKRVGGNTWQATDFRLVCATNRDLVALVKRGRFRLDLYHRIAGWVFQTLPLREHREDILPLSMHFLRAICSLDAVPEFDDFVREYLLSRQYPGNVRELRQVVERIARRHVGPWPISAGDIAEQDFPAEANLQPHWPDETFEKTIADAVTLGVGLKEISQITADTTVRVAIQAERGNLQRAAHRLGVTDRALQLRRAAINSRGQPSTK
jgi:transcriptional regulator with GAF, ATPase, and Fis domain